MALSGIPVEKTESFSGRSPRKNDIRHGLGRWGHEEINHNIEVELSDGFVVPPCSPAAQARKLFVWIHIPLIG